ncbi:MAG: 1-acyl-sn-glycerol-3-phosphate acyltransferase [Bacteroidetes bacterium]|nr:1-acyl-sn-glycerol-3-phosphate acyltransferase [Bacteroidota bacterium]
MKKRSKKAFPTKYYIRFITFIVFHIFGFIYRIKRKMPPEVKKLKSPYVLLGNHVGHWDPFIIGNFLPRFTRFVASDASMRGGVNKFFMTRLGTIPKKKNMRDTKVIRDIVAVLQQGGNVGIFPEAVRNWAGSTMSMDSSTARLIKMLKVPVVVAVLKGMNLFNPRWAKKVRRTELEVEYKLLFTSDQVKELSEEEITKQIIEHLSHDEVEYQRKHMNKIRSDKRAEHISFALYTCPECEAIDSFRAEGNDFKCLYCNYDVHIDEYGFFERPNGGKLYFDNIRDWYNWEGKWLVDYVKQKFDVQSKEVIFEDKNSKIYHTTSDGDLDFIGVADIRLFINRLEIDFKDKEECMIMTLDDLQTISPQINDRLEMYYKDEAYRAIGEREGVSALKWEIAVNTIWKRMGQTNKLAPYVSF